MVKFGQIFAVNFFYFYDIFFEYWLPTINFTESGPQWLRLN